MFCRCRVFQHGTPNCRSSLLGASSSSFAPRRTVTTKSPPPGKARISQGGTVSYSRSSYMLDPNKTYPENSNRSKGENEPWNVAVIGGGLTGLSTAAFMTKILAEGSKVTVYEASDRVGGWVDSQPVEFTHEREKRIVQFERGPRMLRSYAKDMWKFDDLPLYELLLVLGITPNFVKSGKRYIFLDGKPVEAGLNSALRDSAFQGLWGSALQIPIRLKWNRLGRFEEAPSLSLPPRDMSVADFVRMAVGESPLFDKIASALMHGVWGGDIERLSMPTVMPSLWYRYFYKVDLENVIMPGREAALLKSYSHHHHLKQMVKASAQGDVVQLPGGLSSLTRGLEAFLRSSGNATVKLAEPVTKLHHDRPRDQILLSTKKNPTPVAYDHVVSTINARDLFDIVPQASPSLASCESVTLTGVNLWYPKENLNHPYNGTGYLLPRHDGGFNELDGHLGTLFDSDFLPSAPDEPKGTKLFLLLRGAYTQPEAIAKARQLLHAQLGISPSEKCLAIARTNRNCIPQHLVGHQDLMRRIHNELACSFNGTLSVAGPSYTSPGVGGAVRAGWDSSTLVRLAQDHPLLHTGLQFFKVDQTFDLASVPREALTSMGRNIPSKGSALLNFLL